jgi:hypothetical protein
MNLRGTVSCNPPFEYLAEMERILTGFRSRLRDVMEVHAHPFSLRAIPMYSSGLMPLKPMLEA